MVVHGPVSSPLVTRARLELLRTHSLAAEPLRYHSPQGLWALRDPRILTR